MLGPSAAGAARQERIPYLVGTPVPLAVSLGLDRIRDASEIIERARSEGTLTLSCLPSLASKWVAPQLLDWQIGHPDATVRLVGAESEPRLGNDQVDFRISYGDKISDFDHYTELFTDWVVPACSPSLLASHSLTKPARPVISLGFGGA